MKIKRFNESSDFKNDDDAIKEFFIDYIDEDKDCLTISNGFVKDNEWISKEDYIKKSESNQYKKAKLITLKVAKADGVELGTESRCLTSLETLKKAIIDIERFYALSEENINYAINTTYDELEVNFITTGGEVDESDTNGEIIDELLMELKTILNKSDGFLLKRINYKPNFLDIRTPVKDKDKDIRLTNLIRKVKNGQEDGEERKWIKPLVDWVNKARGKGFEVEVGGGDNQVVVRLKKA